MARKVILSLLTAGLLFAIAPEPVAASGTWDYRIDNTAEIDGTATSAVVDTVNKEIRLPAGGSSNIVAFWPDGSPDYLVVAPAKVLHFSFDGTQMVENPLLEIAPETNPLMAAAPEPYPDVVAVTAGEVRYYAFNGGGMSRNPALEVAGLTNVVSVGSVLQGDVAVLQGNQVRRYQFDGTAMVENTVLEPAAVFSNPLAVAVPDQGYDVAVLEPSRVRYFSFTGSGMAENPALSVTGLAGAAAFAMSGREAAVVEGNRVKHYSFDGTQMVYNMALSVTSGLTAPSAVALRPGSYDRLIVDGTDVRYYSFDGSQMVYNPAMSAVVPELALAGRYRPTAVAQSVAHDPSTLADRVRVRAWIEAPDKTSVTWETSADGTSWTKKWRVRGTATGTVLEITPDNGAMWQSAGTRNDSAPSTDNAGLWVSVAPGRAVRWRAVLETQDTSATPKIKAPVSGDVAIRPPAPTPR